MTQLVRYAGYDPMERPPIVALAWITEERNREYAEKHA